MRDCAFHYRSRFGGFGTILAVPGWPLVYCTPQFASSNLRSNDASIELSAAIDQTTVESEGALGGLAFEVEDDHGYVVGLRGAAGEVANTGAHRFGELFGG